MQLNLCVLNLYAFFPSIESRSESSSVMSDSATPWTIQTMEFSRILEWVAIPFSRGSSQCMGRTQVSCFANMFFTIWDTREGSKVIIVVFIIVMKYIDNEKYKENVLLYRALIFDVHACVLSCFSHIQLIAALWAFTCQAPLSSGVL